MVTTIQEVEIVNALFYEHDYRTIQFTDSKQLSGWNNWNDCLTILDDITYLPIPDPGFTNQNFIDWENERLNKESMDETSNVNINTILSNYSSITLQDYELILSIEQQCSGVFLSGQTPTSTVVHTTLVDLLSGTNLQVPTVNYVLAIADVPSIGTNLPLEVNVAIQFLMVLKSVYEKINNI